jgi:enoyl-CoA hydratase/carnithine racemase
MSETVQKHIDAGVAVLTLNRPDRLNAWTPEMGRDYFEALADCGRDEAVRVIVVTGAGRGFCAGADMANLQTIGEDGAQPADGPYDTRPQSFPLTIPKPIIAAVNGACAGIGLVLALMCDLRFAASEAKLTTAFSRRGLVAEYGIAWMLPRLVGPAHALDLLFSGRVVLGEEAAALGLVNRAISAEHLLDETLAYARDLAVNCSPASMAAMKAQVYADLERSLDQGLEDAGARMLGSFAQPDFKEGVTSFLERREPQFAALGG